MGNRYSFLSTTSYKFLGDIVPLHRRVKITLNKLEFLIKHFCHVESVTLCFLKQLHLSVTVIDFFFYLSWVWKLNIASKFHSSYTSASDSSKWSASCCGDFTLWTKISRTAYLVRKLLGPYSVMNMLENNNSCVCREYCYTVLNNDDWHLIGIIFGNYWPTNDPSVYPAISSIPVQTKSVSKAQIYLV